uniref:Immunoglobulin kappa light chain-like n=1 Tax=Xiphophorus maculatus TaxID=8083 RepID=A0A3B5PUI7_XIPMA
MLTSQPLQFGLKHQTTYWEMPTLISRHVQTHPVHVEGYSLNKHFVFAKAGDSLTLQCFYENIVDARFYWYRQNLGQNPRLVSSYYKYETNATFHNEFRNNPRFELETTKGKNHLKIRDLKISDSAVYFCASSYLYMLDFAEGTMVYVEQTGSKLQTSVDQSASETLRPGGSVTLNCTVQTGTCGGEHSVYWFKNSEYSEPGLIHSKGGENKLCKNKSSARTHSCVYKLPISKLDASHAGTYYCAVASCGHILFGIGTKLDLEVCCFFSSPNLQTIQNVKREQLFCCMYLILSIKSPRFVCLSFLNIIFFFPH